MSIRIVVDTNALTGKNSFDTLFGNRNEIEKILAISGTELIVPSVVVDELLHQKSAAFKTAKSRLTESSYYKKRINPEIKATIESDTIDLDDLRLDTSIPYTIIDITDKSAALDKIRQLAINYQAPFQVYSDGKVNSDKGFKDAYIAMTIDEYLNEIDIGENVFLLTNDARLAEYFQDNSRIVRVQSYEEINSQIERPVVTEDTTTDDVPTASVKPLSQERVAAQALLTDYRNSGSFASTHSMVSKLIKFSALNKFTDTDYIDILVSTAQNDQISWLLGDTDVREFILPIFKKYGERLSVEQFNVIASGLDLEGKKLTTMTPDIDFDEMEAAAEAWIELQSDIARGR